MLVSHLAYRLFLITPTQGSGVSAFETRKEVYPAPGYGQMLLDVPRSRAVTCYLPDDNNPDSYFRPYRKEKHNQVTWQTNMRMSF